MKPEGTKLRAEDLECWPSLDLRRRMQLDKDIELARIEIGCGNGSKHSFICWDGLIIKEILENRELN